MAHPELRHDQVDGGGEQGATQGGDKPESKQWHLKGIILANLVKREVAIKSSQIPGQSNDHLAQRRVGVKEEGVLEIQRGVLAIVHLVKDNIMRRFQSEHSGEDSHGE